MSKSRREETHHILQHVRVELREIDMYLTKERGLPDPGEIKALLAQMDALLDLVSGVKKKTAAATSEN